MNMFLYVHLYESIGERPFCVGPYFPERAQHALPVWLGWFVRWDVSVRSAAILKGAAQRPV